VFSGELKRHLAITEPHAGSDVARLQCTAVKSQCGKFYIVNGEKKWIPNGIFADYFTVAVRTGSTKNGGGALSFLVVPRQTRGVTTRRMDCTGTLDRGTTYILFEDAKVPVENLVGKEGEGFKYIGFNFNHERMGLAIQACRFSRVCFEEAFLYAQQRETFGKKLIEHGVIREKLGWMIRRIESVQAWLDLVAYQLCQMARSESRLKLAGAIALLKTHATSTFEFCAREAAQIMGGIAYTKGGLGEKVERLNRDVRVYAIGGGSEEIMVDFGVRQAMKLSATVAAAKL